MKPLWSLPCGAILLSLSALALADDPPPEGRWYGAGQAGLLISSGNADAKSFNAKLDLARNDGPWKNTLYFGGFYGKSGEITSGEKLEGRYQLDHKITDRLFAFGSLAGVRDLFSGFRYQATVSAGLGYKFIDSEHTKLEGIAGIGYQRLEPQTLVKDAAGRVISRENLGAEGDAVGTAGINFSQDLSKSTKLTDKLLVTSGSLNTSIANDLALTVAMSDRLALSVAYGIRDNTKPAPGVKKLDQLTSLNVVYNIK